MPSYETIAIFKPQLSDEQVGEQIEKTKKVITEKGGEILADDRWGRRKLAYSVKKHREGFYAYIKFQGPAPVIERLSHHFKVSEHVLRATTVRALRPQRARKPAPAPKPVAAAPQA